MLCSSAVVTVQIVVHMLAECYAVHVFAMPAYSHVDELCKVTVLYVVLFTIY